MGIRLGCCGLRAWGWAECGCCSFTKRLLWRGLDSAPVGRSAAPGTRETRGEGADLGEGLAAAHKQEAAAHVTTVAADQPRSHRHGHPSAWTGLPERSSS